MHSVPSVAAVLELMEQASSFRQHVSCPELQGVEVQLPKLAGRVAHIHLQAQLDNCMSESVTLSQVSSSMQQHGHARQDGAHHIRLLARASGGSRQGRQPPPGSTLANHVSSDDSSALESAFSTSAPDNIELSPILIANAAAAASAGYSGKCFACAACQQGWSGLVLSSCKCVNNLHSMLFVPLQQRPRCSFASLPTSVMQHLALLHYSKLLFCTYEQQIFRALTLLNGIQGRVVKPCQEAVRSAGSWTSRTSFRYESNHT